MTQAQNQEIEHLEALAATYRNRLRVLERQIAHFGDYVPPHVLLDKEEAEQKLAHAHTELRRLQPGALSEREPYLGLSTFQEHDADLFFGRDRLVADLVERASHTPFLTVLGASGSGKSSVVRAGLVPMLRGGVLPGSEGWQYITLRPGARPFDALAAGLAKLQGGDLDLALRLSRTLAESARALLLAAEVLLDHANGQRLVLVVDQAEELWTLAPPEQGEPFVDLLLVAADAPDTPVLIVLAMRADFLHRAIERRPLAERIERTVAFVGPMAHNELREAITRPVEIVGGGFEPGLVNELIDQTAGRSGALPLLQYTLQELWRQRTPEGTMTWATLRDLGGVEGGLAHKADAILQEQYTPEQREELRAILLRLVQPGEGAVDTRRRARIEDLALDGQPIEAVQTLLAPLIDARLLVAGESGMDTEVRKPNEEPNSPFVEIAHEALIHAWLTFNTWVDEARADLAFQIRLGEVAHDWQDNHENPDFLWAGLPLANAEAWLARARPRLTAHERQFFEASREREREHKKAEEAARREREVMLEARADAIEARVEVEQRSASRLRVFLAVGGVLLLPAVGLTVFALLQREAAQRQARASSAQGIAGAALFELSRFNHDRALLLAQAAISTDIQPYRPLVLRALRQVVQEVTPSILLYRKLWSSSRLAAWSPDRKKILIDNAPKCCVDVIGINNWDVQVLDAASGRLLATWEGTINSPVEALAWSPDGKRALIGRWDIRWKHNVEIWDVESGKLLKALMGHTSGVGAVAWSPDGSKVITGSHDKTARIWDVTTGITLAKLEGHKDSVDAVAWSPDGRRVLTSSSDNTARIWDAKTGQQFVKLEGDVRVATLVSGVAAWSPDGTYILIGGVDGSVRIWDPRSGRLVARLAGHTGPIRTVAWSSDSKIVITGSSDTTVRVWDIANRTLIRLLRGGTGGIVAATWSIDGKRVFSLADTMRAWDIASQKSATTLEDGAKFINTVAWRPDGKQMLTVSTGKNLRVWDAESGGLVVNLEDQEGGLYTAVWSPNGEQVVSSSRGIVSIWEATPNAATWRKLNSWDPQTEGAFGIIWSPDGNRLLIGGNAGAGIWDAASGQQLVKLEGAEDVSVVAWSPDGKQVLTNGREKTGQDLTPATDLPFVQVWDAATGHPLIILEGHKFFIVTATWSLDGKHILTSGSDGTARIWDASSGQQMSMFQGDRPFSSAAWSPDGKQVLTGSEDGTVQVWAVDGTLTALLDGHTASVSNVAWSPDGKQVLTGSYDGTVRTWIADNNLLVAELTRRVCGVFTEEELRREISAWRGCAAELAVVDADLKVYDALRGGQ